MKQEGNNKFSTNVRNDINGNSLISMTLGLSWKLFPTFTGRFIRHFFFNPKKYKSSTEELAVLRTATPFSIKVHDKNLKGWKFGDGPGILLMHGWNGRGIQFHKFIDPLTKAGYSPIIIDGPAHGESEGRHTSYFEFSDVVRYIMKPEHEFNIQCIIGHSFGASAAINCISKDKYSVKLVLIAPALYLRDLLQTTFSNHGISLSIHAEIIGEYENFYGYSLNQDDPINLIADLSTDILLIHDKQDKATPFIQSETAAGINNNIRLLATEGQGHSRILKSDQTVQECINFISNKVMNERELSA
ncbi:alpha/beta hydrolase [Bacteroidota bacterium]